ncbi:MAG TPA: sensor histidine kinase [Vicinamibacterales bacterium]|nr:sensor histidine kinase [Vicinamibacterales bacterium]
MVTRKGPPPARAATRSRAATKRTTGRRRRPPAPTAAALRSLSTRLATVRENERARISRALHDELGQMLTTLKLDLTWLTAEITRREAHPPLLLVNRLQSIVGLVDVTIGTVRRISLDLRPPVLDHLGLAEAVKWEATTFEARTGIRCRFRSHVPPGRIVQLQATVLFRILQEALTNVARHSHAGAVRIDLREERGRVRLDVRDNGRGITDVEIADARSIGLLGMRERALSVGGELTVAGAPGRGTVVTVTLPRPRNGEARH